MKIDATTPIWVVTDPGPHSTIPDICFETTLAGLRLQFVGGLTMENGPTIYTTRDEAHDDARNRLLVWKVARQVRIDRRLPEGAVVRVTMHGEDGRILWQGDVR